MCRRAGVFQVVCRIPRVRLYQGRYTLTVHFAERAGGKKFQTIEDICPFEVALYGRPHDFGWAPDVCAYLEDADWTIHEERLGPAAY